MQYLKRSLWFCLLSLTIFIKGFALETCPKLQANKIYNVTEVLKTDEDGTQWHIETIDNKMPDAQASINFLSLIWLNTNWVEGYSDYTCYCHGTMTIIKNHRPALIKISIGAIGLRQEDSEFCHIKKEPGKNYMLGS